MEVAFYGDVFPQEFQQFHSVQGQVVCREFPFAQVDPSSVPEGKIPSDSEVMSDSVQAGVGAFHFSAVDGFVLHQLLAVEFQFEAGLFPDFGDVVYLFSTEGVGCFDCRGFPEVQCSQGTAFRVGEVDFLRRFPAETQGEAVIRPEAVFGCLRGLDEVSPELDFSILHLALPGGVDHKVSPDFHV